MNREFAGVLCLMTAFIMFSAIGVASEAQMHFNPLHVQDWVMWGTAVSLSITGVTCMFWRSMQQVQKEIITHHKQKTQPAQLPPDQCVASSTSLTHISKQHQLCPGIYRQKQLLSYQLPDTRT